MVGVIEAQANNFIGIGHRRPAGLKYFSRTGKRGLNARGTGFEQRTHGWRLIPKVVYGAGRDDAPVLLNTGLPRLLSAGAITYHSHTIAAFLDRTRHFIL